MLYAIKLYPQDMLQYVYSIQPVYQLLLFFPAVPAVDPCNPSPCGPNSLCRVNNGVAVCSCQPSYVGSPPACRPECVVSAECPLTQACLASKCRDPCPGTCGQNARCQVVNHNPICSCSPGNTGDPFRQCFPIPGKIWACSKQSVQMTSFGKHIILLVGLTTKYKF